jgi:hypothetical protein
MIGVYLSRPCFAAATIEEERAENCAEQQHVSCLPLWPVCGIAVQTWASHGIELILLVLRFDSTRGGSNRTNCVGAARQGMHMDATAKRIVARRLWSTRHPPCRPSLQTVWGVWVRFEKKARRSCWFVFGPRDSK